MRGDHGESLWQRKQLELEDELCVGTALTVRGETAQGGEPWGTQHPKVGVGTSSTGHRVGGGSRVLEPGEEAFRVLVLGHPAPVCSRLQCPCPPHSPRMVLPGVSCLPSLLRSPPLLWHIGFLAAAWGTQTGQTGKTGPVLGTPVSTWLLGFEEGAHGPSLWEAGQFQVWPPGHYPLPVI